MQGFDERLHLVLEHAWHQPFAALFVNLVQGKQRHIDRDAVFGVARLMQISGRAVHATEAQHFWKSLGGDARRLVAHQLFLRQQQQLGLLFDFFPVPGLAAGAAADIRR